MLPRNLWMCTVVVILALAGPTLAPAQRIDGDLRGEVRDPGGAVVPGAKVTVTGEATGISRRVETTAVGTYFVGNLLPGKYAVTVEVTGFKRFVRRGVEVIANRLSEAIVTLELGEVTQVVEVTAGAELVQTATATLVGSTYRDEVTGLANPSATGNPINLAVLAPGTTTMPGGMAGVGGSVGGNRPRQNNFVIDGLDNNSPSVTGPVSPVIADAVEEFTLLTNQFTAEYGHSTAGQFLITTKSGTNEFHGRGWWLMQNRNLKSLDNVTRAVTPPGSPKPRFDWNRFGGQLGGPVLKDKWFFFGSYEYRNLTLASRPSTTILVPTQAGLTALQSLANNPASGVSPVNVAIIVDSTPVASTATATRNVCNQAIDPACPAAALVPIEVGAFVGSTPNFDREHVYLVSQDFITARHRISGRFNFSRDRFITAGVLPVPAFNSSSLFDTRRVTISDVFTINPRVVNELRAAYLRSVSGFPVSLPPAPGNNDIYSNYEIRDQSFRIGPQSNFPQASVNNIYQFSDTMSVVRGSHTLKFGVDVRNIIASSAFLPRARGEYVWPTLDAFVRDRFPTTVSIRGVGLERFAQNKTAAYGFIQDTWKLRPRLTLELGLRYEITSTARDSQLQDLNTISSIPSFRANPTFATLSASHQQALLNHLGNGIIFRRPHADRNNFGPRIGLAWDVFGNGKTSVRGGFAIAHDVMFGNLPLLQLPPQVQAESRESNACSVSPAPGWCALVPPGGSPTTADIRFSTTGFIEGGAIFPTLPPAAQTDPAVARAFTQGFVFDDVIPETYTWSLSLQREFRRVYLVELRYVGTRGVHLPIQRWASAGRPISFRLPLFLTDQEALAANLATAPSQQDFLNARGLLLAPFGFGGVVTMFSPDGRSSYHGGSLSVERRMSRGLLMKANYTWSKTIDLIENELFTSLLNPRRPFNHLDINSNRGLSALHREHKFVVTWLWDLPKFGGDSGLVKRVLHGWQVNGSFFAESGQPLSILSFVDLNGDFDTAGDSAFFNQAGTANLGSGVNFVCRQAGVLSISTSLAGCAPSGSSLTVQRSNVVGYVAKNSNAQYIAGQAGMVTNLGRGTFLSPGINTWNFAIFKNTPITERYNIQFRAEFLNAFNHPSFTVGSGSAFGLTSRATGSPGYVDPTSPQFLDKTIFSGGLGQAPFQRSIQFGLKFVF